MLERLAVRVLRAPRCVLGRQMGVAASNQPEGGGGEVEVQGRRFKRDQWTNATPKILSRVGRNLHLEPQHPLGLLTRRVVDHFYASYTSRSGNPVFSVFDRLHPAVSTEQNFDSLLIPREHPSRTRSDCYYLDRQHLLRAHMTAHQAELLRSGLDSFLMVGDVYRRDDIDATHYPVFHQCDAVRLYSKHEIYRQEDISSVSLFENGERTPMKQAVHTSETAQFLECELKKSLEKLARSLFGADAKIRWVESTFPFTHPSFELEVLHNGEWMELLGCGIMRQEILANCGINEKVGWAFGVGLERLAMHIYNIPDIRLFWSTDTGFLNQFRNATPTSKVTYKTISSYPQCINDLSFWLPEDKEFTPRDFYDLVRELGGDMVEQVSLVDEFVHPKTKRTSHCYRIVYRHMEKTLTQTEANRTHEQISQEAVKTLGITVR